MILISKYKNVRSCDYYFHFFVGRDRFVINRDHRCIFMGTETLLKFNLHRDSDRLPTYAYEVTVKKMVLRVFHSCFMSWRRSKRFFSIPDRVSDVCELYTQVRIHRYMYIHTYKGMNRGWRGKEEGERGIFGFVQNISSLLSSLPTRGLCNGGDALIRVKSLKSTFILHFEQAEIAPSLISLT